MPLALRGLELKTIERYKACWRLRVVPSLGHLGVRMITNGSVDHAVHGWIADALVERSGDKFGHNAYPGWGTCGDRPLITHLLERAGDDPMARLFVGPRGGRITTAVLRDATHWDEVATLLGYEHMRRHDLRKIAGHGSLVTTQRYLHPDHDSITAAGLAV